MRVTLIDGEVVTAFYLLLFGPFVCITTLHASLQSSVLHSQPKSTVGTPAYIAPEVLLKKEYDGKVSGLLRFLGFIVRRSPVLICISIG